MENNANYESEIDLKDMFIYCLLHWRSALVLCLIFGLLIGGFQGFRTYKKTIASNAAALEAAAETEAATVAEEAAAAAEAEEKKTEAEKKLDETLENASTAKELKTAISRDSKIARLKKNLFDTWNSVQQQEKYINENPRMQFDPAAVSRTISTVMVSMPGNDIANSLDTIISEYISELQYDTHFSSAALALNMSEADIRSFISLDAASGKYRDNPAAGAGLNSTGLFQISVDGKDPSSSEKIMTALISALSDLTKSISESTGFPHSVSVLSTHTMTVSDTTYKDFQDNQKKLLKSLYAELESTQDALNKALAATEETAAEKELSGQPSATTPAIISPKSALTKDLIKWSILGFIIVLLLYGLFLSIRYVLGRIKTVSALTGKFPFRILGGVRDADKRLYKGNTAFDKWLRKAAGIKPERTEDEVIKMISSNISVYCEDQKAFIIAGSDTLEHRKSLAGSLSKMMPEKSFTVPSDILNDPEARDTLTKCDAIIFSEIYGKCSARDLAAGLSLLSGTQIQVAGVVTQ